MSFLDDYAHPRKRGIWKYGLALVLGLSLIGSYSFGSDGAEKKEDRRDNIKVLEGLYESYQLRTNGVIEHNFDENFDILSNWRALPNNERSEILKLMLKEESTSNFYRLRDTAENNLDKITMFLLGGGS